MDPRWAGETLLTEDRDEVLSRLANIVWLFKRIISILLSNPDDEAAFQAEIYKKIEPKTANAIISATNCPNRAMHDISTSVNHLPIYFLRINEIDKDSMTFKDTYGGCERLLSYPIPVFYSYHTDRLLTFFSYYYRLIYTSPSEDL